MFLDEIGWEGGARRRRAVTSPPLVQLCPPDLPPHAQPLVSGISLSQQFSELGRIGEVGKRYVGAVPKPKRGRHEGGEDVEHSFAFCSI